MTAKSLGIALIMGCVSLTLTGNASQKQSGASRSPAQTNVLGQDLAVCSIDPLTGFYRNGHCNTGPNDRGKHVVCATMTDRFLEYTKSKGNDLSTPNPRYRFPGLKAGDQWCLCALRWREADQAGVAPPLRLKATHQKALEYVPMERLRKQQLY